MIDDSLPRFEVDQFFPHSPSKVWRALTTPDLMEQWLMPNDFEPAVGHRFNFHGQPITQTGFSGLVVCEVLEVVPEKRLRISWADADAPNDTASPAEWTITWILQTEGSGTRIFLEHAGFDPDDATQQLSRTFMSGGWRSHVLRRFGELLEESD